MMHWGLIGLGDIAAKRVAPALRGADNQGLVAVAGRRIDAVETFRARFGVERGYTDAGALVADPRVDAVYIATPVDTHASLALEALRAGKHVLVEKPMALTDGDCAALVAQARLSGVALGVAYYRRFYPRVRELRRLLAEGAIGDVVGARISYQGWYNPATTDPKYWRVQRDRSGGGPLWDIGCHRLDLLVALLGEPVGVSARLSTVTHGYEVEDTCSALLDLPSGGQCLASFQWNAGSWADEFVVFGTKGKLCLDPCDGDTLVLETAPRWAKGQGKETTTLVLPNAANVHAPLVDEFVQAVEQGRPPLVSGEEGAKTNRLLGAIARSSSENRRIDLTREKE